MITGVHGIIFSPDAEAARAFFRDVLGFPSVDAGGGWLIFALPPAELGVHPAETYQHELYFMCDDIQATVQELQGKGVRFSSPIEDRGFGLAATLEVPGGGQLSLYQPKHPTAIGGAA
jgi:catechol 2,3-dioxygenase-like lactoylglutathione lyase family enzyme